MSPHISPILDVRVANGCKYGLKFAVFLRPAGQCQGGNILARFGSVELAEAFIGLYPEISRIVAPEPRAAPRLGLLKGGRDSRMLFCGR